MTDESYTEAFDELAKAYEDPSYEIDLPDADEVEPEDSSDITDEQTVSQPSEDEEAAPEEQAEPVTQTPTELPLNYKELYEKVKRDAESQNTLWASRLNDLSGKYQELKQTKETQPVKEESEEMPDNVKELFDIHPEIANAVKTLVESKVSAVRNKVESEFNARVEPIQQQIYQSEAERHLSAIRAAHPDIAAILDSGDLGAWIDTLPPVMQNGAKYVYQHGTAPEVISLLNDYKAARGVKTPRTTKASSTPAQVDTVEETEDIVKQVLAAMAVRTGKEPIDFVNKPKPKPKEKSFDDFAKEYERSRRTR